MLETLEKVDTVVVDKTGTLTEGRPKLTECIPAQPFSEEDLLRLAASVEQNSEHPLAHAIVVGAKDRGLTVPTVEEFDSVTGGGVHGTVEGKNGPDRQAVAARRQERAEPRRPGRPGRRVAAARPHGDVRRCRSAVRRFARRLRSRSRPRRRRRCERLHDLGLRIIMLTGDNEKTAKVVAEKLGIDEFHAGVRPEDKHERIKALRAEGRKVAMAGDGINDAPALAEADVGIAMGTGTDVAIESAGVTLVKGDLRGIVKAIELSRRTMRNIRQNLFFALIYNALGVPIAAGVLYPISHHLLLNPMIAAAAMSFSSVSVVGNALRLRTMRLGQPNRRDGCSKSHN